VGRVVGGAQRLALNAEFPTQFPTESSTRPPVTLRPLSYRDPTLPL
jgi:hypothetical protein